MLLAALLLAIVNLAACTFREAPGTDTGTAPYDTAQNSGGSTAASKTLPPDLTTSEQSSTSAGTATDSPETSQTAASGTSDTPGTETSTVTYTGTTHSTQTTPHTATTSHTSTTNPGTTIGTTKTTPYTTAGSTISTTRKTATSAATTAVTEPPPIDEPLTVIGACEDAVYGVEVSSNEKALVDSSNKADGFLMIKYLAGGTSRIIVRITGPDGSSPVYDLNSRGDYEQYPLTGGNGTYTVRVSRNTHDNYYAPEFVTSVEVTLSSQFAPYLHSNQKVYYSEHSNAVEFAHTLARSRSTTLRKVEAVYNYIVTTLSYDSKKTITSRYIPDIDEILNVKKGICYDYAALMAAMLRSMGIPTKVIFGYVDAEAYHAWINVYINGRGWINGVIYFDGTSWKLMDPTFASTSGSPLTYVPNESRYTVDYQY
jgi:hypothetical protein